MKKSLKFSLLSATALLAASAGGAAVANVETAPTEIAAPLHHAIEEAASPVAPAAFRQAGLIAALAATFSAFVAAVGWKRIRATIAAAGPVAAQAARLVASAPAEAAKAVGRAVSSPFRYVLLFASLGLFALTGVGLFDVEWAGGLLAGAGLVAMSWFGAVRTGRLLSLKRAPQRSQSRKGTGFDF